MFTDNNDSKILDSATHNDEINIPIESCAGKYIKGFFAILFTNS